MDDAKHTTIPIAMLGAALAIFGIYGFAFGGAEAAGAIVAWVGAYLIIGVVLGLIGCFIAASLLDISFGPIGQASLKLAAIFAFPGAVALFFGPVGWLVALLLYFGLLWWLFDLEGREVLICAITIWLVRYIAMAATMPLLAG